VQGSRTRSTATPLRRLPSPIRLQAVPLPLGSWSSIRFAQSSSSWESVRSYGLPSTATEWKNSLDLAGSGDTHRAPSRARNNAWDSRRARAYNAAAYCPSFVMVAVQPGGLRAERPRAPWKDWAQVSRLECIK